MSIAFRANSPVATFTAAASTWSVLSTSVAGDLIIVAVLPTSSSVDVSDMTDNVGNTFVEAVKNNQSPRSGRAIIWYAAGAIAGSTRISLTLTGASSGGIRGGVFTGANTTSAEALIGSTTGVLESSNSSIHDLSSITPTMSSALVFGGYRVHASSLGSFSSGPSFDGVSQSGRQASQYWIQTDASSNRGRIFTSSKVRHVGALVIFRTPSEAGGGAASAWREAITMVGCQ